jgi:hypothetical protein
VIAFYQALEPRNVVISEGSAEVRHGGRKALSIHTAAADYQQCGNPPRPGEQTAIVVSQMLRRW